MIQIKFLPVIQVLSPQGITDWCLQVLGWDVKNISTNQPKDDIFYVHVSGNPNLREYRLKGIILEDGTKIFFHAYALNTSSYPLHTVAYIDFTSR
jgi:hypothetical protein